MPEARASLQTVHLGVPGPRAKASGLEACQGPMKAKAARLQQGSHEYSVCDAGFPLPAREFGFELPWLLRAWSLPGRYVRMVRENAVFERAIVAWGRVLYQRCGTDHV